MYGRQEWDLGSLMVKLRISQQSTSFHLAEYIFSVTLNQDYTYWAKLLSLSFLNVDHPFSFHGEVTVHFSCYSQGRGGFKRRDQDSPGIEAYYRHSMVENPWRELEEKYKDRIQQEWMAFELFAIVYEHFLRNKFFFVYI